MNESKVQYDISRKNRKIGKLIYKGHNGMGINVYECSLCQQSIYESSNFCPKCGTRMCDNIK